MAKELHIIAGPDKGKIFTIPGADPLLIGRSKATTTQLTDPHVSRVHCQVQRQGERTVLSDTSSVVGTLVNGKRVRKHTLRAGDVIKVGETEIRFVSDEIAERSTLGPDALPGGKSGAVEQLSELAGKTLSHYEVGAVLAKGQTGMVFRARDTKEEREVALKVLQPEFSKNDDEMQRFIRAIKTMLPLRHPNLVTLYGAGKTGGYCWIAMEYVEGESMTQVIQRIGTAGMLDWKYGFRVAVHIARALDYAYQQQVIHRNITPQNILLRSSDKLVKLGDLMLAKALEGTLAMQITKPGELLGEIPYMSPERTRGTTDVDCRSDIYSLGATVYALLTGRPPFEGDSLAETIQKIRQGDPVKPKKYQLSIPDLFEGAVLHMLAKRPEDRFQTPAELLEDLERVGKLQAITV